MMINISNTDRISLELTFSFSKVLVSCFSNSLCEDIPYWIIIPHVANRKINNKKPSSFERFPSSINDVKSAIKEKYKGISFSKTSFFTRIVVMNAGIPRASPIFT